MQQQQNVWSLKNTHSLFLKRKIKKLNEGNGDSALFKNKKKKHLKYIQ